GPPPGTSAPRPLVHPFDLTEEWGGVAPPRVMSERAGSGARLQIRIVVMAATRLRAHDVPMTTRFGFLLYPDVTQLDLTGPYEVFHRLPGAEVHLAWKDTQPVRAQGGLHLVPTTTLAACPPLDVLCVPGGFGARAVMADEAVLEWLRAQASTATYV